MIPNRKVHLPPPILQVAIVGVGGTGSYLAQGLAKMVAGYRLQVEVVLIDPDTIEAKNCARQNFLAYEIGQPKAEALAFRLNQQYGVDFGALVDRGEKHFSRVASASMLLVTCVDSVEARKPFKDFGPWLDLGNGVETGQAIYGTTVNRPDLAAEAKKWAKSPTVGWLPGPYLVAGMAKLKSKPAAPSCADHPFAEQGCFANEWSAQAGLTILHQLLVKGELTTPQISFDTACGRMVPGFVTKDLLTDYMKGEK